MSANPQNAPPRLADLGQANSFASPGLNGEDPAPTAMGAPQPDPSLATAVVVPTPGHEALQALLAFSSLHEQIRQRRARERLGAPSSVDAWELEQFVLDEVLQLVSEKALTLTEADGIAIALADGNAIVCRASAGSIAPEPGARLDPDSAFSGAVLRTGGIVRCDDSETDPRVDVQVCRRLGSRSIVAVPISSPRCTIGVLEAFSATAHAFNDSDVRSLNLLAELILAAMKPEEEDRLAEVSQRLVGGDDKEAAQRFSENNLPAVDQLRVQKFEIEEETDKRGLHKSEIDEFRGQQSVFDQFIAPASSSEPKEETRRNISRAGFLGSILVLSLAALAAGMWWSSSQQKKSLPAKSSIYSPEQRHPERVSSPADAKAAAGPDAAPALHRLANGIWHSASIYSSTVVIDLQDEVQYEAHRLSDPERIYFDLHGQALAHGLFGKTIEVGDSLLARVRIAQPRKGVSRIVLETNGASDFSVSLQSNPYRLVVEIRKAIKAGNGAISKLENSSQGEAAAQPGSVQHTDLQNTVPEKAGLPGRTFPGADPQRNDPRGNDPRGKDRRGSDARRNDPRSALLNDALGLHPASIETSAAGNPTASERRLQIHVAKFRLVLDAGHGGWDLGTVGRKGLMEKDLVLDVVERLGKLVQSRMGAEVIYTRESDTYLPLEKRTEIANLAQADMFVSVHANYSDDFSARGAETYYTNSYSSVRARTEEAGSEPGASENMNWNNVDIREKVQQSRRFAVAIQQALHRALALQIPGMRNRGVKKASYVVLTGTAMPAVLAEVSFVSSPADEEKLKSASYRQNIAEGLYKGIAQYAATTHHTNLASASSKPQGL